MIERLTLAEHIERVRKRTIHYRQGLVVRELPGGWMSALPGRPAGEYASASLHRVYWLTLREKLQALQIGAAADAFRALDCRKLFAWLAPWACNTEVEGLLKAAGARHVHWIDYIALMRASGPIRVDRTSDVVTRRILPDEAGEVFARTASWYGELGAASAAQMVRDGVEEAFGAFLDEKPVGVGLLCMDAGGAGFGYLGAAATDPEFRDRGAQTALIAARCERVFELGARWCTVETNSAVPISRRNLERCGFERTIDWRVYAWDLPA